MRVVSLWSGGKDSCFACYKALALGYQVCYLFNFTELIGKNSLSHGLPSQLILEQANVTGIPVLQKAMPKKTYEKEFKALITHYRENENIEGIVFGDIYLREHKDWIERVCKELNIKPIFPIWGRNTKQLVFDFIDYGFEAVVICVDRNILGDEWLGRQVNRDFIKDLQRYNPDIDPCGEKGEFHTLVTGGPLLKGKINIIATEKEERKGRWFLEIKNYRIVLNQTDKRDITTKSAAR